MLRRYRKKGNRPRKARKSGRKSGRIMPSTATSGKGQMAKIIETIQFGDLQPNLTSQSVFTLSQFPRAATLAGNFAFYKAAKVSWNYEPLFNTFQDTAGSSSTPYLYTLMNRGQTNNFPVPGLGNLQACGARPVKLVAKTTIAYKPNWCSPGLISILKVQPATEASPVIGVIQQGVKQQYSWLACSGTEVRAVNAGGGIDVPPMATVLQNVINPTDLFAPPATVFQANSPNATNSVVYNGHYNFIDQQVDSNSLPACRLTATVEWHFKGALFNQPLATPTPV